MPQWQITSASMTNDPMTNDQWQMTKIFNFHHHYKKPLLGLLILLIAGGVYSYTKMKTGLFPDITFPKIKIIADAGQQPVDKMMTTVTIPIENAIRRTEGLDYIRSTTSRGSVEFNIFLKWDADVDKARLVPQVDFRSRKAWVAKY